MTEQPSPNSYSFDLPDVAWKTTYWFNFAYPNVTNFNDHINMHNEIKAWLKEHIEDYKNTTMCSKVGDCIYVKLKNSEDAIMFILKFGAGKTNGPI